MKCVHFCQSGKVFGIIDYRIDDLSAVPAVEIDQEAEIVQTLASSIEAVTGTRPPLEGAGPACDGWMFITRGIPQSAAMAFSTAGRIALMNGRIS